MVRRSVCAALLALGVAGCGGATTEATSSSSSATSSTSPAATVTHGAATTTDTVSAGSTTTAATTSAPEVPKNRTPKHTRATKPDTNVRIPAAFVIGAGAKITPPQISVPPNVRIELHISNQDTHSHSVTLSVPHFTAISVPAGGQRTVEVTGVPKGTYRLSIDRAAEAKIVVGVVPGP